MSKSFKPDNPRYMLYEDFYKHKDWVYLKKIIYTFTNKKECFRCESKENLQIDHIKPKSKYPEHSFDIFNLQILCKDCNFEKSAKYKDDYRPSSWVKDLYKYLRANKQIKWKKIKYRSTPTYLLYEYPTWYKYHLKQKKKGIKKSKRIKKPVRKTKYTNPISDTYKRNYKVERDDPKLNISKILELQSKS